MRIIILTIFIFLASVINAQPYKIRLDSLKIDQKIIIKGTNRTPFFDELSVNNKITSTSIEDGAIIQGKLVESIPSIDPYKQFIPRGMVIVKDNYNLGSIVEVETTPDSIDVSWPSFWITWAGRYARVAAGTRRVAESAYNWIYVHFYWSGGGAQSSDSVKVTTIFSDVYYEKNSILLGTLDYGIWTNLTGLSFQGFDLLNDSENTYKHFIPRNLNIWHPGSMGDGDLWEWTGSLGTSPDSSRLDWPEFWMGYGGNWTRYISGYIKFPKVSNRTIFLRHDESANSNSGITADVDIVGIGNTAAGADSLYNKDRIVLGSVYFLNFTPAITGMKFKNSVSDDMLVGGSIATGGITPIEINDSYVYNYNNVSANVAGLSSILKDYLLKNIGSDSLFIIDIIGSSIFGANGPSGTVDTTQNPVGTWTPLQGLLLSDSLQYNNSDLQYYTRSNASITWNGTWNNRFSQWSSYYCGGKRYKESYGNVSYSEITVTNCTNFAIIYEAKTDGDILTVTVNGGTPAAAGITGSASINTTHSAGPGEDYIQAAHSYYSGLTYATSYTFRFTKSSNTSLAAKIWGYMKWSKASVHIVTNARSGSGGFHELDDLDENVYDLDPDLVINQFHDVNLSPSDPSDCYDMHEVIIDSIANRGYPQLCIISNKKWPEGPLHRDLAKMMRLLCSDKNVPVIDIYALTKENNFADGYFNRDGVHPSATGVIYYVNEILKVLQVKVFGGM